MEKKFSVEQQQINSFYENQTTDAATSSENLFLENSERLNEEHAAAKETLEKEHLSSQNALLESEKKQKKIRDYIPGISTWSSIVGKYC